jgi:hypothetical protein
VQQDSKTVPLRAPLADGYGPAAVDRLTGQQRNWQMRKLTRRAAYACHARVCETCATWDFSVSPAPDCPIGADLLARWQEALGKILDLAGRIAQAANPPATLF